MSNRLLVNQQWQSIDLPSSEDFLILQNLSELAVIECIIADDEPSDQNKSHYLLKANQESAFTINDSGNKLWLRLHKSTNNQSEVCWFERKKLSAAGSGGNPGLTESQIRALFPKTWAQRDTVNRTFNRTWKDGFITAERVIRDSFNFRYYFELAARNDSTSWGGGYAEIWLYVNDGAYQKLCNSGYNLAMGSSARLIRKDPFSHIFKRGILGVPAQGDFTAKIKLRHRSYNGTLYINKNRGSSDAASGSYHEISEIVI